MVIVLLVYQHKMVSENHYQNYQISGNNMLGAGGIESNTAVNQKWLQESHNKMDVGLQTRQQKERDKDDSTFPIGQDKTLLFFLFFCVFCFFCFVFLVFSFLFFLFCGVDNGAVQKRWLFCGDFYFFVVDDVMMITIQILIVIEKIVFV